MVVLFSDECSLQPEIEKSVIDDIAFLSLINEILILQYRQCLLDAAGTWQFMLADEVVGLRLWHQTVLCNGFQASRTC